MTLTATQLANTTAGAFDVRLQYFAAGAAFADLTDLADFAVTDSLPTGWSAAGNTITATGTWADCTADIVHDGQFKETWSGGKVTWSAAVRGYSYDADLYSAGYALACLRRIVTPTDDSGWVLWWVGVLDAGEQQDDYRQGQAWSRSVRGLDAVLELTDSPRITTASLNVLGGASASASSTLATPAAEAGNGEFIGASANVEAGNVVDGRMATVWVSHDVPTLIGETPAAWSTTAVAVIDEVFNSPWPGYSRATTWWFEIFNNSETTPWVPLADNTNIYTLNDAGEVACLSFKLPGGDWTQGKKSEQYTLEPGQRGIVCADRRVFDTLTGGMSGAQWVLEAKSWGTVQAYPNGVPTTTYRNFDLHATGGFLALASPFDGQWHAHDLVLWGAITAGDVPDYCRTGNGEPANGMWQSPAVDISGLTAGESLRRIPTGQDTNLAADWGIEPFPRPGDKWESDAFEWLKITAPEHVSTLGADAAAGATTLTIQEGTTGWLTAGTGLLDYEAFSYTGRTATTLTGVTGLAADHLYGVSLWPTDSDGDAMTGWYTQEVVFRRRAGLSTIERGRVYLSANGDARSPTEVGWESDYHAPGFELFNDRGNPELTCALASQGDQHWVRAILLIVDKMSDDGRAKLNECELTLNSLAINQSGLADLGAATAAELISYLLTTYTDYGAQFIDSTPTDWGQIGSLALAIAPLPKVLADVSRVHGCVLGYRPNGTLELVADPWWPGGKQSPSWLHLFDEDTVRGQWALSDARPSVTGVTLNATGTDGAPLARVVIPPGATGSAVKEISGYTVRPADVVALGWNLYWQERNPDRLALRVKGVGEWCSPLQRLLYDWGGIGRGQFISEAVAYGWGPGKWECRVDLRRYFN